VVKTKTWKLFVIFSVVYGIYFLVSLWFWLFCFCNL